MRVDEGVSAEVLTRLRRVEGQIGGIARMIEDGRSCDEVVTQLAAAARALDRVGFKIIASGIRQCAAGAGPAETSQEQLEKLFLSLA